MFSFMYFEKRNKISPFKMHKIICVSTLPKIFRPDTGSTLIFYLA